MYDLIRDSVLYEVWNSKGNLVENVLSSRTEEASLIVSCIQIWNVLPLGAATLTGQENLHNLQPNVMPTY